MSEPFRSTGMLSEAEIKRLWDKYFEAVIHPEVEPDATQKAAMEFLFLTGAAVLATVILKIAEENADIIDAVEDMLQEIRSSPRSTMETIGLAHLRTLLATGKS